MADLSGLAKKDEAQTLREKLTTHDPDLKCPKHDAMSLMLSDINFCCSLFGHCGLFKNVEKVLAGTIKLEYPATTGTGKYKRLIGFIDAFVTLECSVRHPIHNIPIQTRLEVIIEAKPTIDNPMEVLRQINTYRQFVPSNAAVVWCPSIPQKMAEMFKGQGVLVGTLPISNDE